MDLLITILATIFILFGLGLMFSTQRGTTLASIICIGSAVIAYDSKSFFALVIGFGLLWALRIFGIEERN